MRCQRSLALGCGCEWGPFAGASVPAPRRDFLLISNRLSKTTGQVITVDGGLHEAFLR